MSLSPEIAANLSPEQQQFFREAEFGIQVEQWLETPIARFILQKAADERETALADLVKQVGADPTDAKALAKHYATIERADSLGTWLIEAVQLGLQAQRSLEQSETTD